MAIFTFCAPRPSSDDLVKMAQISSSMGVSGQSKPRGYSRLDQMNAIDIDSDVLPSDEREAHVVLVGQCPGLVSHWASLWIFDDGTIWSVELSAVDPDNGARWGSSHCRMKLLVVDMDGDRRRRLLPCLFGPLPALQHVPERPWPTSSRCP